MSDPWVVAVDGGVASGKTTVAFEIAERLGALAFDTGIIYRALAWLALHRQVAPDDAAALSALASEIRIESRPSDSGRSRRVRVLAAGRDVTDLLHTLEVERIVPAVAGHPRVRAALLAPQRQAVQGESAVVAGRDMGSTVFPTATLKVYLIASAQERARRRSKQRAGDSPEFQEVLRAILQRDQTDARQSAPAADAVPIDTEHLTVTQVVDQIVQLLRVRTGGDDAGASARGAGSPLA